MNLRARPSLLFVLMVLAVLAVLFSFSATAGAAEEPKKENQEEIVVIGPTTREQIEDAAPAWVQAEVDVQPNVEAARALASVHPGAEVTVFLGTWCGDSHREVPRFWKALAEAGLDVPFAVRYIGVDRGKKEPAGALAESGVRYLPTFIVRRGGHETGRIVESSPNGVERDLLNLLTGKEKGVLSTREDMKADGSAKPSG